MIDLTVSSVITSQLLMIFFVFLLKILIGKKSVFSKFELTIILSIIGIYFLRIFMPFELPFTRNIYSFVIFPKVMEILNYEIPLLNISLTKFLLFAWITGIVVKLVILFYSHLKFKNSLTKIENTEDLQTISIIEDLKEKYNVTKNLAIKKDNSFSIAAIVGIINPIIIIPNYPLTYKEEYFIIEHELNHYLSKDLLINFFSEIMVAVFWWNPIIYILKNDLSNFLELRNDNNITNKLNKDDKIIYLESFLKVSKEIYNKNFNKKFAFLFSTNSPSLMKRRVHTITVKSKPLKRTIFFYMTLIIIAIFSYSIIFEPYITHEEIESTTFELNEKNTYAVKNGNRYDLYLNDEFFGTIDNLDNIGFDCPIKN